MCKVEFRKMVLSHMYIDSKLNIIIVIFIILLFVVYTQVISVSFYVNLVNVIFIIGMEQLVKV